MDLVPIFENITSGPWSIAILGGLIVILIERLIFDLLIPVYQGKVQKLTNFNDTEWTDFPTTGASLGEADGTFAIKQRGNKISAKMLFNAGKGERTFIYKGKMYGNQIVLEFHDEKAPQLIVGTMVLHIGSDLKTLRGASTFFHQDKGEVLSEYSTLKLNSP